MISTRGPSSPELRESSSRGRPRLAPLALAALPLLLASLGAAPTASRRLPAIVFVSRHAPEGAARGVVPGLGLAGRTLAPGGRLMVREASGRVRPLLAPGLLWDASDPCVSWDARSIVFAGTVARDSAWRIWVVGADGRGLRAVTRTDRTLDPAALGAGGERFERYDDFDPCWLPDGRICFASTRYPQAPERGAAPVSNLFTVRADGTALTRLTSERSGAEEPAVDPATGRIVFSRWLFNRWLASESEPAGVTLTTERAVPTPPVSHWQAVSVIPNGDGLMLAAGDPRTRPSAAAYQPAVGADRSVYAVRSEPLDPDAESPRLCVQRYEHGLGAAHLVAGFNVLGANACAPAPLANGDLVIAMDREGNGDWGLWCVPARGAPFALADQRGTFELDPAPLVRRRAPPVMSGGRTVPIADRPATRREALLSPPGSFRFDCLNVFAQGPVDSVFPDAPLMQRGVRIRFYAALSRPGRPGGDTLVMLREQPVEPSGAVHVEDMPGDVPMFEQLVDAEGKVLRTGLGLAHVPGFNWATAGSGTKCVGCHTGHSALPVAPSAFAAKWTNASPSAELSATSEAEGSSARGAVDRSTVGSPDRVAWVARDTVGQMLQLRWRSPIEVREVVLYAIRGDRSRGTDLQVGACEIALFDGEREVERTVLRTPLSPLGTRAKCTAARVNRIEIRPLQASGRVLGRAAVGLAEVETIARLTED